MNSTTLRYQATRYSTSTYYLSVIETNRNVVTSTKTETSIFTSTISSADTATSVRTVTVNTPLARRARALAEPSASPTSIIVKASSSASPKPAGTTAPTARSENQKLLDLCPRYLEPPGGDLFKPVLMRRQAPQATTSITTGTTTIVAVSTITTTSLYRATSTYETTTTITSTSTTVLRAGVTVTSTTTTYQARTAARTDPSASGASVPPDNTSDNTTSSGLSTGAKAGIGAGAGIAAISILALAFLLWRKRKSNNQTVKDTPVATSGPNDNPALVAATYYANEPAKSMRSSTMSPPYSPQSTVASPGPGPYVYEAASSDGRNMPYAYPVPGENGQQARPYVYEAQGREVYHNSPPTAQSEMYGHGHGQEMYSGGPQMTQELYAGMPPQEMGRGTPVVSHARPYGEAWRQG